jgi:general secretion pathway protein F
VSKPISVFRYTAYDRENTCHRGMLDAVSREGALARLAQSGLTVVALEKAHAGISPKPSTALHAGLSRTPIPAAALEELLSESARLLSIGLTIDEALMLASENHQSTPLGKVAVVLRTKLKEGAPFHQALAETVPTLARGFQVEIAAAERGGRLPGALADIALRLTADRQFRTAMRGSLVYPGFVVAVACCVVGLLLGIVVPSIEEVIGSNQEALTTTAQAVFALSRVLRAFAPELGGGAVVLIACLALLASRPRSRACLHRLSLCLPLVGPVLIGLQVSRFARTLGTQIAGGVGMTQALDLAAEAIGTASALQPVRGLARRVAAGTRLSDAVACDLMGGRELSRLIRVGEENGRLAAMLEHGAALYEERAKVRLRWISTLVTPVTTVVLGFIIGFIVLSLMSAITSLNETALR